MSTITTTVPPTSQHPIPSRSVEKINRNLRLIYNPKHIHSTFSSLPVSPLDVFPNTEISETAANYMFESFSFGHAMGMDWPGSGILSTKYHTISTYEEEGRKECYTVVR